MENLLTLNRKELQTLAKEHGIKANKSNKDIIEDLQAILASNTDATEVDEAVEAEGETTSAAQQEVHEDVAESAYAYDEMLNKITRRGSRKSFASVNSYKSPNVSMTMAAIEQEIVEYIEQGDDEEENESVMDEEGVECLVTEDSLPVPLKSPAVKSVFNLPPWNSSCKAAEKTDPASTAQAINKRFSNTPNKIVLGVKKSVVIMPKLNKTQQLRQEAIQQKLKLLEKADSEYKNNNTMSFQFRAKPASASVPTAANKENKTQPTNEKYNKPTNNLVHKFTNLKILAFSDPNNNVKNRKQSYLQSAKEKRLTEVANKRGGPFSSVV